MIDSDVTIGGAPVVTLQCEATRTDAPSLTRAVVAPARGMMVLALRAHVPSLGDVDVLDTVPLDEAARRLIGDGSQFPGNATFGFGAAMLVPFANRIRGTLSADGRSITTRTGDRDVTLPANWGGKEPGSERYAMHGLILDAHVTDIERRAIEGGDAIVARYDAGDFGGHWPSSTQLEFEYSLRPAAFMVAITATNTGGDILPMGIGSHPYFRLPSGDRSRARLHVPAHLRAIVNNYDEVLPTGQVERVHGTPYDFSSPGGRALGTQYLDDCFLDLQRPADGVLACEIIDPDASYAVRITSRAPAVTAVQVYAPLDKAYVALEPQFNLADPFGEEWPRGSATGMVMLAPGESVSYRMEIALFTPDGSRHAPVQAATR